METVVKLKKFIAIILTTITAAAFAAVFFSGCKDAEGLADETNSVYSYEELDEAKVDEIKQASVDLIYTDAERDDVQFRYYGRCGNSVYVLLDPPWGGYFDAVVKINVDGVNFWFPNTRVMKIYNKGHFYKLTEAFEKKIVNHDSLEEANNKLKDKTYILY